jgi:hypothetical protein
MENLKPERTINKTQRNKPEYTQLKPQQVGLKQNRGMEGRAIQLDDRTGEIIPCEELKKK